MRFILGAAKYGLGGGNLERPVVTQTELRSFSAVYEEQKAND